MSNNIKYYLVDKNSNSAIKIFADINELRKYLYSIWEEYVAPQCLTYPLPISMTDKQQLVKKVSYNYNPLTNYYDGTEYYTEIHPYYILDDMGRIFNYTEMFNEFHAHKVGRQITYGIGHTYKGSANTKSPKRHYPHIFFGYKRHYSSPSTIIIKKSELVQTYDNPVDEILEDCYDCGYDVSEKLIKNAVNSMRSNRKLLIGGYTYRDSSKSWKEKKKRCQWE